MAAEPGIMIICVAQEGARVSTIREYASTGLGAPSILDLIKFCLKTNLGDHLGMARTLKVDAIANLEVATGAHKTHDNVLPKLRLLPQQLGVA